MPQASRRRARQLAFQIIYNRSKIGINPIGEQIVLKREELPETHLDFARSLIEHTWMNLEAIDQEIQQNLKSWKQSRIAESLNALMRVGVAELLYLPDTEAKVVINESLELCKSMVDRNAVRLLNGVLDAVWKKREQGQPVP